MSSVQALRVLSTGGDTLIAQVHNGVVSDAIGGDPLGHIDASGDVWVEGQELDEPVARLRRGGQLHWADGRRLGFASFDGTAGDRWGHVQVRTEPPDQRAAAAAWVLLESGLAYEHRDGPDGASLALGALAPALAPMFAHLAEAEAARIAAVEAARDQRRDVTDAALREARAALLAAAAAALKVRRLAANPEHGPGPQRLGALERVVGRLQQAADETDDALQLFRRRRLRLRVGDGMQLGPRARELRTALATVRDGPAGRRAAGDRRGRGSGAGSRPRPEARTGAEHGVTADRPARQARRGAARPDVTNSSAGGIGSGR